MLPLTKAVFHGKTERWDTDVFVRQGRFYLRHVGLLSGAAEYGDTLEIAKAPNRPGFRLPTLSEQGWAIAPPPQERGARSL